MNYSKIVLRLEYIFEKMDYEPYEKSIALTIKEYEVGEYHAIPGKPILALQKIEDEMNGNRYNLYRVKDELPIELVDVSEVFPHIILFKVSWHRFLNRSKSVTAAYDISEENLVDEIEEERGDLVWKYILKKQGDQYNLVHIVAQGSGNVTECEALANRNINCKNPKDDIEEMECQAYKCPPPRPKRNWWPFSRR